MNNANRGENNYSNIVKSPYLGSNVPQHLIPMNRKNAQKIIVLEVRRLSHSLKDLEITKKKLNLKVRSPVIIYLQRLSHILYVEFIFAIIFFSYLFSFNYFSFLFLVILLSFHLFLLSFVLHFLPSYPTSPSSFFYSVIPAGRPRSS